MKGAHNGFCSPRAPGVWVEVSGVDSITFDIDFQALLNGFGSGRSSFAILRPSMLHMLS